MEKTIILVLTVFLIGAITALSITPNEINLNLSAGDSITIPINITSEIESDVLIKTDNQNCVIENGLFHIKDFISNNLTIYVIANSTLGDFECGFNYEFVDYLIPDTSQTIYVSTGGGGIIYKNKTVYLQQDCPLCDIKNITNEENITQDKNYFGWIYLSFGLIILMIGALIFFIVRMGRKKPKKIEDRLTETKNTLEEIGKEIEENEETQN